MFAQWNVSVVLQERFAQLRRGKKFESDNGHAMDEELAPHEISQAARGRDDCACYGRQRQGRNRLEPPQHDTFPSVRKRYTRMKADKSLVLLAHTGASYHKPSDKNCPTKLIFLGTRIEST